MEKEVIPATLHDEKAKGKEEKGLPNEERMRYVTDLTVSMRLSVLWVNMAVWRCRGREPSDKASSCILAATSASPSYNGQHHGDNGCT